MSRDKKSHPYLYTVQGHGKDEEIDFKFVKLLVSLIILLTPQVLQRYQGYDRIRTKYLLQSLLAGDMSSRYSCPHTIRDRAVHR